MRRPELLIPERCLKCGAPGPDSSGRCYDCANRDTRQIAMEMNDKRSIWKLRDIDDYHNRHSVDSDVGTMAHYKTATTKR